MSAKDDFHNRREFIRRSAAATAGFFAFPYYSAKGAGVLRKSSSVPLVLIEKGTSSYVVALNSGASRSEQHAAQELVKYFEKCTGVRLSVKKGGGEVEPGADLIVLGCGNVSEQFGVNPDADLLGEQGYLLETVGRHLIIAGTSGAGTLYGVYQFLEQYLGVRWYAPGVTKTPSASHVSVSPIRRIVVPSFLYREPYYAWPGKDRDFLTHLRINSGKRSESSEYGLGYGFKGMAHSYFSFISPEKYFDDHPEYFSEIGGRRIRQQTQLCLTNPEVFEIVAKQMLDAMREHPEIRQFNFSQMDYYNGCQCEHCRAVNVKYQSEGATQFEFVNRLAECTSKEFPDKLISTLAYTYTEAVPVGMEMHSNAAVWLCHMLPCCDSHSIESCERNAGYKQRAVAWSKICRHLYVWHYITDFAHYYSPFPNFRAMASDFRFYQRIGVEGIFAQGIGDEGGGGEFSLLRGYYCAQLLWDAQRNPDEILKDFLHGYYGAAWNSLWEYINLLHDEVEQKNIHLHLYSNPAAGHLSDEIITQADGLFDQAEAAVVGDAVLLDRVKVARMPLNYAKLFPRNGYRMEAGRLVFNGNVGGIGTAWEFVQQMQKHGFKSIREGFSAPGQLLGLSSIFASGVPVITLDNGVLSVDVVPFLAGRILRIVDKESGTCVTAHNKVKSMWFPFAGGQESRVGEVYSLFGWTEPAEVIEQSDCLVSTRAKLGNGLMLERRIGLADSNGQIRIISTLINPGGKAVEARLRSHLELENVRAMQSVFVNKAGKRIVPEMKEIISGMREGIHYYREDTPDGRWSFQSEELELVQSFDPAQVEFVNLCAYPEDLGELELELWLPLHTIGSGETFSFEETIEIKKRRETGCSI